MLVTDGSSMRTYISPIGYNSTTVTRPVISRGVDTGDAVVMLRPRPESDDSRAEEAVADVERMLTEIEPETSSTVERIAHDDFQRAVLECSDVIRAADGDRIVNLGGGAREILLPFTTAAVAHAQLVDTALSFSDVDGTVREWKLPALTAAPSDRERRTLETIAELTDGASIPDVTKHAGVSKSTVTRHVDELERVGAVDTWRDGKTKHVRLTLTGKLLRRAAEGPV